MNISHKQQAPLYQFLYRKVFSQSRISSQTVPFSLAALQQDKGTPWRESVELSPAIAVAQVFEQHDKLLVVMPIGKDLKQLYDDLQALGLEAWVFPDWGSSQGIRQQNRLFTERSSVLARILQQPEALVLCSLQALAAVLPPPAEFAKNILHLRVGSELQPGDLAGILGRYGYYQVPRVTLPGEFALRGEVLDFYPPQGSAQGSEQAVRAMFGFDEVELLKIFDINSQISQHSIAEFPLHPLKEVLWGEAEQARLREQVENLLLEDEQDELFDDRLEEVESWLLRLAMQQEVPAEEQLFPFAWDKPASLRDYMPDSPILFWGYQRIKQRAARFEQEQEALYEQSRSESSKNPLSQFLQRKHPKHFAVDCGDLLPEHYPLSIIVDEFEGRPWPLQFEAAPQYHGNLQRCTKDLEHWLEQGYNVAIAGSSTAQVERLRHIVCAQLPRDTELAVPGLFFFCADLSRGQIFPEQKFAVLQEWEILGGTRKNSEKAQAVAQHLSQSEIIDSFVELKGGDLVVHVQHGVGRFTGIERVSTSRMERDYLSIEYADKNTLFVPIEQVNMVQRYIGSGGDTGPRLDRIGGKAWGERKAKAQKAVEDLADRLLRLYTRRAAAEGFCYASDDDLMEEFEADFPYEATRDQLRVAAEIKRDLESPRPMDRLLCGDVGFGKTEIAMRASFKVASQGRQVLLLCPTTILAEQHYQNFCKRFERFPLRIAMLSRFVERKQQKAVLHSLESGEVDILIGTHRILAKDIHLRKLGLIVIDEEQRFGVKHKERLKMLKTSVDCLSMSATPIPRTLHMSLVQIRDISMITTAPRNRHPVETFVGEFNPASIASAIRRELGRRGQVFYLHNRIEGLEEILRFLRDLVPEALIAMAHGQMESKELEDIMYRFVHGAFNVLLATSIIENGIDIPNVNTIIIDRADRYGIGQLYQLRGRVGRSQQLAYAYLFYPDGSGLSELALKRLKIISDFSELGSGFKVAMKDLEVRGAGNLLGSEQSGNILSVGFAMYSSMLAKAMNERKYEQDLAQGGIASSGEASELWSEPIFLELDYSGFIPDSYIPDAAEKIDLYKRISSIDRAEVLKRFYEELFDRFGTPPPELYSLLSLAELRSICREVGINFLKERGPQVELQFSKAQPLPLERIMQQIQREPSIFRIDPQNSEQLLLNLGAYMQRPAELPDSSEQSPKRARKSRNADYLGQSTTPRTGPSTKAEQSPQPSDTALLQKTAALHKLLSSFRA